MSSIHVYIKDPGKKPRSVNISPTLKNLQTHVGGYIEAVTLASDMAIICNEEGKLRGLPYNCTILNEDFVGTLIFVGVKGEEFCDVPCDWKVFKLMFPELFEEVNENA